MKKQPKKQKRLPELHANTAYKLKHTASRGLTVCFLQPPKAIYQKSKSVDSRVEMVYFTECGCLWLFTLEHTMLRMVETGGGCKTTTKKDNYPRVCLKKTTAETR